MKRLHLTLTLTLALLLVAVPFAGAAGNANPGILPPNARVQGMTYAEWEAMYGQVLLTLPVPQNPLAGNFGANCYMDRVGNLGLLVVGGASMEISCEVPAGMPLAMVVIGVECDNLSAPPFYGGNEEELRAVAMGFVPQDVQASIDGVPVQSLSDYLILSPVYDFTLPEDNIFGLPAGTVGQSIMYSTFLMLAPLSPGQHTIYTHGVFPDLGFDYTGVFHMTVTPGP